MIVTVIEVIDANFSLIEYELDGKLHRKLIPQAVLSVDVQRVPVNVPDYIPNYGIEYSDVDLEAALGEEKGNVRISDLEQALRRAGIWTQEDYRAKAKEVDRIVKSMRGQDYRLDTTTVLNAAMRPLVQPD
jgi:hypothetical protein